MKKKILGLALVIAGLASVGMIHSASKRQDENRKNDRVGTYKERLHRAKARGDKKMRSGGVISLYAQVNLDQALEIYDLVIGEFVSSKSVAPDENGTILTWYKFKVHETLSQAKLRVSKIDSPPPELLPLANDEILIWKTGGSVELDGMEIEMEDVGFPPFENSKKYLLILAFDPAKQAGTVEVGPSGALLVKSDDTVEPLAKNRTYFKREIENRYGASVSKLREKLNKAH
jgi:hypothetical protein